MSFHRDVSCYIPFLTNKKLVPQGRAWGSENQISLHSALWSRPSSEQVLLDVQKFYGPSYDLVQKPKDFDRTTMMVQRLQKGCGIKGMWELEGLFERSVKSGRFWCRISGG